MDISHEIVDSEMEKVTHNLSQARNRHTRVPARLLLVREKHLAFIDAAPFQYLAKQKDVEIFTISMQDIEYQLSKTAKTLTDPKTVVPEEYHEFLDVFSKKASDTLTPHSKYDHQIRLLEGYRHHGHSSLSKMSEAKLQFIKKYLEEHLKKGFIDASNAPCSSPIMLAAKPGGGIRFCVDYRKLNELTKKDAYPIPLIEETLAQLKNAKVFTKIDIRQVFHKLRMVAESEDLTTFSCSILAVLYQKCAVGVPE